MQSDIFLNQWLETGLITDPTMNTISKRHMEWALVDNYILIKQEWGCFQTSVINPCILHSPNFTSESQFLAFNTSINKLLHFLIKNNFRFHYSNWFLIDWNTDSKNLVLASLVRRVFDIISKSLIVVSWQPLGLKVKQGFVCTTSHSLYTAFYITCSMSLEMSLTDK